MVDILPVGCLVMMREPEEAVPRAKIVLGTSPHISRFHHPATHAVEVEGGGDLDTPVNRESSPLWHDEAG